MKLTDLDNGKHAVKALKESFDYNFDPSNLSRKQANVMLNKVQKLKQDFRKAKNFYENQSNPSYMKLVFMEEALLEHMSSVKSTRIVVENVEVEKSQVILAAQDMIDSVQKMLENVSDMLVKELPALSDSMTNEIGVNESQQFNQSAVEALTNLQQTLVQTRAVLQSALDGVTGQGGSPDAFAQGTEPDMGMPPEGEIPTDAGELPEPEAMPEPTEEPEAMPTPKVGREKR